MNQAHAQTADAQSAEAGGKGAGHRRLTHHRGDPATYGPRSTLPDRSEVGCRIDPLDGHDVSALYFSRYRIVCCSPSGSSPMILAGRRQYVRTSQDLARDRGTAVGTLRNTQPYHSFNHPEPISSPDARVLLWDGEQTDAYFAGRPIPQLPKPGSDEDLLDRQEAAVEMNMVPRSWDNAARTNPALVKGSVVIAGVRHWPRGVILAFKAGRPGRGRGTSTGRPRGSGDLVPRDEFLGRIAELLDADSAVTAATVTEALGVSFTTAQTGLARLRGQRIADVLEATPDLTPTAAADRLGYPPITQRRAVAAAATEQRVRGARPYILSVLHTLEQADLTPVSQDDVRPIGETALTAAFVLPPDSDVPALVWDDRYGWRTATNRRHPIGKDTGVPPEGPGIRYLGTGTTPDPAMLLADLTNWRTAGRNRPDRRT